MMGMLLEAALRSFVLVAVLWAVLAMFRVREARVQSTLWRTALAASLLMPLLMQLFVVQLQAPLGAAALPGASQAVLTGLAAIVADPAGAANTPAASGIEHAAVSWHSVATFAYLAVAGILLLRLFFGLALTWRMARAAGPVREKWTKGLDARVSEGVTVPVTFGSVILLPADYANWSPAKRQAVMAHERSHVENGDFTVQILTGVNRAVFWFNPLAWWLHARLVELAETISDDTAIEEIADRPHYAEVLLDMSNSLQRAPAGVAMARPATVGRRIERILAATSLSAKLNWSKRVLLTVLVVPLAIVAAVGVAPAAPPQAAAAPTGMHKVVPVSSAVLDSYVGYYQFDPKKMPNAVFTVTRTGDHLSVQLSGQPTAEIFPEGPKDFFYTLVPATVAFKTDASGHATGLILRQNGIEMHATRTDAAAAARANAISEKEFAEQQQPRTPVAIDPRLFDGYVGRYRLAANAVFTVTREGDHLFVKLGEQPKFEVYPSGPKDFFYTVTAAQLTFVTDANGRATELVLHQAGRDMPAPRID